MLIPALNCSDVPDYDSAGRFPPSGTISINTGDLYSQSADVALDISVSNASEMCFSTDDITYTAWEAYDTVRSITLPSGHGIKTVFARFRNADGEITITDTISPLVEQKIFASEGTANACFGGGNWNHTTANLVLTHDGSTMITSSATTNKVYIYRKNSGGWSESILTEPAAGAIFGQSIACTPGGEYLVVGAMNGACINIYRLSGSAYTFEYRIISPTPEVTNDYAVTVSISDDGNRILAGSWGYGSGIGRAYLYQKTGTTWALYTTHIFENTGGATTDRYGLGVKISGDGNTIAISTIGKNSNTGSIHIFRWDGSGWTGSEYVTSDGISRDMLGRHIAMSYDGSRVIAGTRCWTGGNTNQGAAYLFEWNGSVYTEAHKFTASDGVDNDLFGLSVAMTPDGNRVVIGATFAYAATVKGKAYVFTYGNSAWKEEAIISASDGVINEFYGNVAAVSGDGSVIAVSSPLDTIGSNAQQGSVYLYY